MVSVPEKVRQGLMAVGALAALGLGGSALADAASNGSDSQQQAAQQGQRDDPGRPGRHVGANGRTERPLSSEVAARVKAAAQAKVPGGTIERVETDVDHGSPYEAHVRKADGTELEVLVDEDFEVTDVVTMGRR